MKHLLATFVTLTFLCAPLASIAQGKAITVKGELAGASCDIVGTGKATHFENCIINCKFGENAVVLIDSVGKLYVPIDPTTNLVSKEAEKKAHQKVTIVGLLKETEGQSSILVRSIE
jgi:type 1 fimbria pilin